MFKKKSHLGKTPDPPSTDPATSPDAMTDADASASPEEWEIQRDHLKSQGDAHFRSRSYPAAIAAYESALRLDPTDHILLSNKSAAHLAHGEKSKALHEARKCVECAPQGWAKGHTRLAAALASLGRYGEAGEVYARVLREMDGSNEAARRGLEDCREKERRAKKQKKEEEDRKRDDKEQMRHYDAPSKNDENTHKDGASGEEDDLLDDFFSQVEQVTAEKPKTPDVAPDDGPDDESKNNRIKIHLNDLGTSYSQINRLLQTNYEWKNLNPFYVLDISHAIDDESILSARYRALSLLVHPDKNPDDADRAKAAFEQVRKAMNQLNDEVKRKHIRALVEQGHRQGKRDWEEAKRKDASLAGDSDRDREGLLAAQGKATMKIFAEIEAKRRDVERRKRKYEQRERAQEDEEKAKEKNEREHDIKWRETGRVEKRVGNWRDFQMGSKKK
ncbi:hypothetical protein ACHAW6_010399 [Cyclotella cf. meneghiniana]